MRTVDYIDLFNATALAARLPLDDTGLALADGVEFTALRALHSMHLQAVWNAQAWPFLLPCEQRYFRTAWASATNYAAPSLTVPVEVFYPGPQKYYQALRASSAQAPASYSAGTWTTNPAYWAESAASYSANPYSATTAYVQGNQAYDPVTNRVYQLYVASSTGNNVTDASKWGVLTPFDRYIAYDQSGQTAFDQPIEAWDQNPRISRAAQRLDSFVSDNGLQVRDDVPWAWLEFRRRCPALTGAVFSATTAYTAGQQVYYSSATLRGNFYDVATGGTIAGDTPDSATAKFSLTQIPLEFQQWLVHAAAADYLHAHAENDEADRRLGLATAELGRLELIHFGAQPRRRISIAMTR